MKSAVLIACLALAACQIKPLPAPSVNVIHAVKVACVVDGIAQPVVVVVVGDFGNTGSAIAGIDKLLVHPLVVAGCAQINGTPQTVTPIASTANPKTGTVS